MNDAWSPLGKVFTLSVETPGSNIFDIPPGSMVLGKDGWKPVNPLHGLGRIPFHQMTPEGLTQALIQRTKQAGHHFTMSEADLLAKEPAQDPKDQVFFGHREIFSIIAHHPGDDRMKRFAKETVALPWIPPGSFMLFTCEDRAGWLLVKPNREECAALLWGSGLFSLSVTL